MRISLVYIFIALAMLFFSCDKETAPDCFKRNGEQTTETRYIAPFSTLVLNTDIEVEIIQSPDTKIELIAGKNLIPKIITAVNDKVLEIDNTNNCNFVRGYKKTINLKVYTPYLRTIKNKGVGNIRMVEKFTQDSLQVFLESVGDISVNGEFVELVTNSGSHGDVYVKGNTRRFFVYISGTNYVKAEELTSDYVYVNSYGLGDTHLNLSRTSLFQYLIRNDGNIYYKGNPQQLQNIGDSHAQGKLILLP